MKSKSFSRHDLFLAGVSRTKLMKHAVNLRINLVALIGNFEAFCVALSPEDERKKNFIFPHMILFTELHNVLFVSAFFSSSPCSSTESK